MCANHECSACECCAPCSPPPINDGAYRQWNRDLTSEHRSPLGGLSDYLIDRQEHEVDARMDDHRSVPTQRRAKGGPSGGQLRDRRINDAFDTEFLIERRHGITNIPGAPQALPDGKHLRAMLKQPLKCVPDCWTVGNRCHRAPRRSAYTRANSCDLPGNGSCIARFHASSISCATSASMDAN